MTDHNGQPAWLAALDGALQSAFSREELRRLLSSELGVSLEEYEGSGVPFAGARFAVIEAAAREGWERRLVHAALRKLPDNPALQKFACDYPELAPPMLHEAELQNLVGTFAHAYPTYSELKFLIESVSPPTVELEKKVLRTGGTPPADYLARTLAWFNRAGRMRDLIDAALQGAAQSADPALRQLLSTLRETLGAREKRAASPGRNADPFLANLLEGRIFLDRQPLRDALRACLAARQRSILAIEGPSCSGKSYSKHLVRYICGEKAYHASVAVVDLKEEQASGLHPGELTRRILQEIGRKELIASQPSFVDPSQTVAWVRDLVLFLRDAARDAGHPWVIVLDGFHDPQLRLNLHADTRDLMVPQLVFRSGETGSWLRLMLLGYVPEMLQPLDTHAVVARETIGEVQKEHVVEVFRQLAEARGEALPPEATPLVDDLMKDLPADCTRLRVLAERVRESIESLLLLSGTAR